MWSTAPNTPTSQQRTKKSSTHERGSSYEKAVNQGREVWGGGDPPGGGERRGQIPRHISSNQALNGAGGVGNHSNVARGHDQGFPHIPDVSASGTSSTRNKVTPDIISPTSHSPSKIHRGFMPSPCDGFDTTNSADLPGSRGVITTPPHPQGSSASSKPSESRPRARSIEEADKHREKYAPVKQAPGDPPLEGAEDENSYCFGGLSSFIVSQESGRGRKEEAVDLRDIINKSRGERDQTRKGWVCIN